MICWAELRQMGDEDLRPEEATMPRIVTNLWFDNQGEEAAEFYCSVFPSSKITHVSRYPEGSDRAGQALTIDFELDGTPFTALNGGPEFTFDEAISIVIECQDQDEIDRYWKALTDGGEDGPCGWIKDRYGLSWQLVPANWSEVVHEDDPEAYARAFGAVMQMHKLDLAAIEAAAKG
jgi:predicted 3-demethylubiquinone-9 3-methyltransferase (glyoxalase superfamily)